MQYAEPKRVSEIFGGRYDGAFEVESTCPGCGNPVTHILHFDEFSSHRVADCRTPECRGKGYDVVRPRPAVLPGLWSRWWRPVVNAVGFGLAAFDAALAVELGEPEDSGPGPLPFDPTAPMAPWDRDRMATLRTALEGGN